MVNETVSSIIINRTPEFVRDEYPLFVSLLTHYFEWLESNNGLLRPLLNSNHDLNIDNLDSEYIDRFIETLGFISPNGLKIQKNHLIHFLKEFYLSRGNEQGLKFLFNAFFNSDVAVDYPRRKLAYASNTTFGAKSYLYSTATNKNSSKYDSIIRTPIEKSNVTLTGVTSRNQANVENIFEFEVGGIHYIRFQIVLPDERLISSEPIEISNGNVSFFETIVPVGDIQIIDPGHGYRMGDVIKITSPQGIIRGSYLVTRIKRGKIDSLSITTPGTGYSVGDMIFADNTTRGAGFSAEVNSINGSGGITSIRIINPGWGYDSIPLPIIESSGAGAVLQFNSSDVGQILEIKPIQPLVGGISTAIISIATTTGSNVILAVYPSESFTEIKHNTTPVDGVLGRNCILTDSNLFQQFSYEVISPIPAVDQKHICDFNHPVGYMRFNVLTLEGNDSYQIASFSSNISLAFSINSWIDYSSLIDSDVRFIKLKVIDDSPIKPMSLSINTLDNYKFSDSLDFYPLEYKYPVIDSLTSNRFMYEAFESDIQITTV